MAIDFSYIDHDILGDVADAIRFVEGSTAGIAPADYPQRIRALKHLMTGFVIDKLPYFEDFEGYTGSTTAATGVEPECWEMVQADVSMTDANRPQIYYKSSYAHSGNYSLALINRGVYAMPALADTIAINTLLMEMYVRQDYPFYQLQVGVWEDDGSFTPVTLVNNSSNGVERVEVDFSSYTGSGHRIAFHNILASDYDYDYAYNFIDDIFITYNNNQN